jgi:hypothetical protein
MLQWMKILIRNASGLERLTLATAYHSLNDVSGCIFSTPRDPGVLPGIFYVFYEIGLRYLLNHPPMKFWIYRNPRNQFKSSDF